MTTTEKTNGWTAADKSARSRRRAAAITNADPATAGDVMDLERAAEFLQIGMRTLRTLVSRGEIPFRKVGRQLRFSRPALLAWLQGPGSSDSANATQSPSEPNEAAAGPSEATAGPNETTGDPLIPGKGTAR